MASLLNNPLLQSSVLPLLLSLILAAVTGFSSRSGARLAAAAIGVSMLLTLLQIQGLSLMPRSASQKLPWLIAIALLCGVLLDLFNSKTSTCKIIWLILPAAMLTWLLGTRAGSFDWQQWAYLLAIYASSLLAYRQCPPAQGNIDAGLKLLFISIGLGAIALLGSSALLGQTAFALSAAIGGFLLLNWPRQRFGFNAASQLVCITVLGALLAQALFFSKASGIALLLLLPLLFIDRLHHALRLFNHFNGPYSRAISLSLLAVILLPPAIGSAYMLASAGSGY